MSEEELFRGFKKDGLLPEKMMLEAFILKNKNGK
jgi:hypothetical protein